MTIYQAERKWNIPTYQIKIWIKQRKIPAIRFDRGGRVTYDIPDDCPIPKLSDKVGQKPSEMQQRAVLRKGGVRGYIAKFAGTFSIRHMADFLGVGCDKVRWIYDDIVAKGGL